MTIAIDADDVATIRKHLRTAAEDVGEAVPQLPGAAAFGPQVLGSAVASFEAAMRREADRLAERWAALDTGVRDTLDDMSAVEDELVAGIGRYGAVFGAAAGAAGSDMVGAGADAPRTDGPLR
ncbi:hypothetical protein GCM10009786_01130 [Leucobacter alluvii]|uniref:Excreted virulence factor EspC (Type VII ESX diderm) n=1 Tax=Leucobacter alluvii TaxID=340321 RepID=A0ABP5MSN0_9MICO